jgi:hypothetical protein
MRERGISTLGGILLAALAGVLTAGLIMDWMIVDVRTPEPESMRIWVPFPLVLGRIATAFIPDHAFEDAEIPPEVKEYREEAMAALEMLLDGPDATFVKVDSPDAKVEVSKEGDNILVLVDADDAVVRCKVPLDGIVDALDDWDWESVDPSMAFKILGAADFGEMVRVEAEDGTKVAIKMW